MKLKLIAITTVILFLVVMSVPVYADTTIPDPPSSDLGYWIICTDGDDRIVYYTSERPITVETTYYSYVKLVPEFSMYVYENNQWEHIETNTGTIARERYFKAIYQSNHDIEYEDGSGFFFLRPKVSPLSQGMKEADSGTILRNFSVGLIPIIGCLILVISLRKGWEFLRTQLKH